MEYEIITQEDEHFYTIKKEKPKSGFILDMPQNPIASVAVVEQEQPSIENKKGHRWFDGTSWGLK